MLGEVPKGAGAAKSACGLPGSAKGKKKKRGTWLSEVSRPEVEEREERAIPGKGNPFAQEL